MPAQTLHGTSASAAYAYSDDGYGDGFDGDSDAEEFAAAGTEEVGGDHVGRFAASSLTSHAETK